MRKGWLAAWLFVGFTVSQGALSAAGEASPFPPAAVSWPRIWFGSDAPRDGMSGAALREVNADTGKGSQLADIRMGYGISSITRDGDALWVTSYGGEPAVTKVSLSTRKAAAVSHTGAYWITSSAWLAPYLWLGTSTYEGERSGLVRYDPAKRKSIAFATESGLPSRDILGLAAHGRDLWVLTPAGVAVMPRVGKSP